MKKILFFLALFPLFMYGQSLIEFKCPELDKDFENYNALKGGIKSQATKLMSYNHMNDDGEIQYQYILETDDTICIQRFMSVVDDWVNKVYKNPKESLVSKTENSCEYKANIPNVGKFMGMSKITLISASLYFKVDVKPNRIRLTGRVKHYQLIQGSLSGPKDVLCSPNTVFPFTESTNEKSYAMAFCNSNATVMNTIDSFLKYLNKNYNTQEEKKQKDDNW